MSLKKQLLDDLKAAMKGGDKLRLSVIRMVQAAVKNKEIDARGKEDNRPQDQKDDENVLGVLKTFVKQRKEAIEQFTAGGRQDLVDQEKAELEILQDYLPQQMSSEELEKIVAAVISESGATSKKDMGKVMKEVIAKTQGQADNKVISELVKAKLP